MDWGGGLTVAAVMVVVPLALKALLSSRGKPPPGVIRYSTALKVFALVITLGPTVPVALVLATSDSLKPDDRKAIAFIIALFLGLGGPLALEFFRVRHEFDEEGLRYRTPWTPRRALRWADATLLKWSLSMKWLVIRDTHGAVFRISPMEGGLEAFATMALRRLPPAVLQASPTGAAVLELMRRGVLFGLVMSQVTPEMMVRDLPPEGRS